jgi:phage putative head morphogenesis protein, SPP1 gp7 family
MRNEATIPFDEIDAEAERVAEALYNGTFEGAIDEKMVKLIAEKLLQAIEEGYGQTFDSVTENTPDFEMMKNLEKNVYQFSAAKNYQQLKTLTLALKDSEGNIISFADFKKIAAQINDQYNKVWLQTEYDTAVGSAQMAGKWVSFAAEAVLEYATAGDERVRESHALLDGIRKLKTDDFWNKYYPPNGFRCRCNVIESTSDTETPDGEIQKPPVPEMFQVNLAKRGLAFPPKHPYYIGVPKSVLKQAS